MNATDDRTPMEHVCVYTHELYLTLARVGFSEEQAFFLASKAFERIITAAL